VLLVHSNLKEVVVASVAISESMGDSSLPLAADGSPRTLADARSYFIRMPSVQLIIAAITVPLVLRVLHGGWGLWDVAVVALMGLYWPVQEWVLHQYMLHLKPFKLLGFTVDPIFAKTHRLHHRDPWHLPFVFLPVELLLLAIPVTVTLWFLLLPGHGLALTGIVAFNTMGLLYEWTHYLTHTRYIPKGETYRRIWKNHRLHHCKNENYWFGFTLPQVDALFGTEPEASAVATSGTCRTLGVEESLGVGSEPAGPPA
jgi:hypothetical protein